MKLGSAQGSASMVEAMKGVSSVMAKVNNEMDVAGIRECLKEFAKQSDKMEMQGEMMNDAINMGMDTADDEEQANQVYDQICGEIGIDLESQGLGEVGKDKIQLGAQAAPAQPGAADDLEARLE